MKEKGKPAVKEGMKVHKRVEKKHKVKKKGIWERRKVGRKSGRKE